MSASKSTRRLVATLGATRRHHPDADVSDLQRDLKAQQLADYIERVVAEAPLLSAAQRDRLALLLRPGGGEAA